MPDSYIHVSIKRSVLLWSITAVFLLSGLFYYRYSYGTIPVAKPEETVRVKSNGVPIDIPDEFQKTLESMGITGLALVDKGTVLQAFTPDGVPINLCGPKSGGAMINQTECDLGASPKALVGLISTAVNCGVCITESGGLRDCNKATNRWRCFYNPGFLCSQPCQ